MSLSSETISISESLEVIYCGTVEGFSVRFIGDPAPWARSSPHDGFPNLQNSSGWPGGSHKWLKRGDGFVLSWGDTFLGEGNSRSYLPRCSLAQAQL